MCVCCEGIPNDEVRPYDSISKDGTDSISNSVESVLTEVSLIYFKFHSGNDDKKSLFSLCILTLYRWN